MTVNESPPRLPDLSSTKVTVEENFPGLWPAVEAGLSVCATLFLEDNANPAALIYVGEPSSSKTTVADMFTGHRLTYHSDSFTPASFVSQAANVTKEQLAKVDLLPKIQHKVLITPELAPIFRGKDDELAKRFAILTRVLDGGGLQVDAGTHGHRGYVGDYMFAWMGCTTPFGQNVWTLMAQLGSRLFFWVMEGGKEITVDDLVASLEGSPYRDRLAVCKHAVHDFLTVLEERNEGVRGVRWAKDEPTITAPIAWFGRLVAAMRSVPATSEEHVPTAEALGGHLKTGQSWTGQNRPVG
jgi:hypothetical protein